MIPSDIDRWLKKPERLSLRLRDQFVSVVLFLDDAELWVFADAVRLAASSPGVPERDQGFLAAICLVARTRYEHARDDSTIREYLGALTPHERIVLHAMPHLGLYHQDAVRATGLTEAELTEARRTLVGSGLAWIASSPMGPRLNLTSMGDYVVQRLLGEAPPVQRLLGEAPPREPTAARC